MGKNSTRRQRRPETWNFQDLRNKEVINSTDGRRLGFVCDIEINIEEGRIESIIVPGRMGFLWIFGRSEDCIIPWKDITKIGDDIILVNVKTP